MARRTTRPRGSPYAERICYIHQPNARVAAARNTGLAQATGDVLAFLDADDAWHPAKLERQLSVLDQRPDIGLLATLAIPWPGDFPAVEAASDGSVLEKSLAEMLVFNPLTTSSVVVRRAVLDRAGAFDTELFGPEDYDLWLRCANRRRGNRRRAVDRIPRHQR